MANQEVSGLSSMAAAAFPEVAFFTFHPVLLMPNLAWLTGPSLPLENWQRALTVPLSANLAPWL